MLKRVLGGNSSVALRSIRLLIGLVLIFVLLSFLWVLLSGFFRSEYPLGYNDGYQPEQPLAFDHSLHAGKYQIPCLHCHVQAENNRFATVPSLNMCMNCHKNVAIDKPSIQRLTKAYNAGYSIPWLKVHLLPDFVMFNHQAHVSAGVSCQKCHGPIEEMQEVYQHSSLSMGWCINCHRDPKEAHDFNWDEKESLEQVLKEAPTSCGTCHY